MYAAPPISTTAPGHLAEHVDLDRGVGVQVTFAYAAGPLAWSVVAFRNSLVFHSVDKVRLC